MANDVKRVVPGIVLAVALAVGVSAQVLVPTSVGVSHVEPIVVSNSAVTCALSVVCTIGTATFKAPFRDTNYRCGYSVVGATPLSVMPPTSSSKTTTTVTVSGLAVLAILSPQPVTIEGVCAE